MKMNEVLVVGLIGAILAIAEVYLFRIADIR